MVATVMIELTAALLGVKNESIQQSDSNDLWREIILPEVICERTPTFFGAPWKSK
jgi:hypothetical protein